MKEHYLITGGAGFIGTNLAGHYLSQGKRVTILDNFSRAGATKNVCWLQECFGQRLTTVQCDLTKAESQLVALVEQAEVVFHLAGQVAVTTSVAHPRADFEANAWATLNLLEAVRASTTQPIVVYSSTNKVYGKMADVEVVERHGRYTYAHLTHGISEKHPLDFYSPYGCSKGAADQYVLDYAHIYGLRTVVFRQSCIYGPHQFGIEDQGWVAWFAIRAMQNLPITIYGDGKQVRDVLYIDDLLAAYDAAVEAIASTSGQAYNMGGGPQNTLSLLELIGLLEERFKHPIAYAFDQWRPGDQRVFVSDIRKAQADFGWDVRTDVADGITRLVHWLQQNKQQFLSL